MVTKIYFFAVLCGASDDFFCVVALCRDVSLVLFVEADLEDDLRTKTDRPTESARLGARKTMLSYLIPT